MNLPHGETIKEVANGEASVLIEGVKAISKILNANTDLAEIDMLIQELGRKIYSQGANARAVREVFQAEGFGGLGKNEAQDYCHSDISYVLKHHKGLPIANSMIVIASCQGIAVQCSGINFPGMFLISVRGEIVEPVNFNAIDYTAMVRQAKRRKMSPPASPRAASNREVLSRMFNNLHQIALSKTDYVKGLEYLDYISMIVPDYWFTFQQRALIWFLMGDSVSAESEIQKALEHAPDQETRKFVQAWIDGIERTEEGDPTLN